MGVLLATVAMARVGETERWQGEIDRAAAQGGGIVRIPSGRHLVGQLDLKSNVELHLERGAVLEGAVGLEHYRVTTLPYSEGTWSAVVSAIGVTNVAVTGSGEIFGNGVSWAQPGAQGGDQEGHRARGIFFADCTGVRLRDFTLRDAACWGVVFKCCDGVDVRGLTIDNHANYNNDGIDIEARNVVIADCDIDSGDDAVCLKSNDPAFVVENVLVTNVVARSHCNALKLGTASHGTMRNILFVDCRTEGPRRDFIDRRFGRNRPAYNNAERIGRMAGASADEFSGKAAIAIENVDGGIVENVRYSGIRVKGARTPIFIRAGTRSGRSCGTPPSNWRVFRNITVENVTGEAASGVASSVTGVPGCRISDVTLRNVRLVCRGLGADASRWLSQPVPEAEGGYPDADMFAHPLPAYGLYARHVDGLRLENVVFELRPGDADGRQPVVGDDCVFLKDGQRPYSVNVKDFGAVGDGVHDDTLALQKAADAARVDSPDRGQLWTMMKLRLSMTQDGPVPELYFPKGVYRTTGPVVFTGNAFLRGEGAEIRNETSDRDTFFFDLGYRVDIDGLRFTGGRHQVRQFTQNRDIASARISDCTFERSRGTALMLDCFSDVKVKRSAGKAAFFKSMYETRRTPEGRVELVDVDPASRNPAANSTIVLVENCAFRDCAQAVFAHSDGVNIDRCSFFDSGVARGPIVEVRTTTQLSRLKFDCRGCVPGRTAIAFGRGSNSAMDIDVRAPEGMDPFRFVLPPTYTITYDNYGSSLNMRNVTLDTGTNPVLTVGAEYLPEMVLFNNVRRVRPTGAKPKLFDFRRVPTEEDLKSWASKHRQARFGVKGVFGWSATGAEDYDLGMPVHLAQLRCPAGRTVEREYSEDFSFDRSGETPLPPGSRSVSSGHGPLFTDAAIGVADCRQEQDDTDRVEALFRRAAEAGGGTVLLPPRWITLSRTLDVPRNVRLTSVGKAVIRSMDYRLVFFRAGENPDAVFENILFNRGATVLETAATKGRVRFENCHFYDQDGVTLKAQADGRSELRLEVRYGTSFVPHLYDGNAAPAVFDSFWLEYAPDFDKTAWDVVSEKSQACFVNRPSGVLRCYGVLGVPCVYWHAAQSTKDSAQKRGFFVWAVHPEEHPELYGDFRWVDNYGDYMSLDFRYGGEWAGLTPVYQYGAAAKSLLAGHIVGGSLYGWTKAKHATVLSDREEANVVLTDLFCMNRMDEPAVVFWRNASGRLARAKGWVKENCYPHDPSRKVVPLKVLAIGNSFAESLLRELPAVAANAGCPLDLAVMVIGGCTFERHFTNFEKAARDPSFRPYAVPRSYVSGGDSALPKKSNIQEMLKADRWDVVTVQQGSRQSAFYDTYQPYANRLIATVRELAPQAEIRIQQTWSYSPYNARLAEWKLTPVTMYEALRSAYGRLAAENGLKVIPVADAVQLYRERLPVDYGRIMSEDEIGRLEKGDVIDFHGDVTGRSFWDERSGRVQYDSYHMNREGAYLQACVWLAALFDTDVTRLAYEPALDGFGVKAALMRRCAAEAVASAGGEVGSK